MNRCTTAVVVVVVVEEGEVSTAARTSSFIIFITVITCSQHCNNHFLHSINDHFVLNLNGARNVN